MKATVVLHSHHGILSVYSAEPLDLEVLVDESEEYHEGITHMPYYWLEVELSPEQVGRAVARAGRFHRRMAARAARRPESSAAYQP